MDFKKTGLVREGYISNLLRVFDTLAILLCGYIAYYMRFGELMTGSIYLLFLFITIFVISNVFNIFSIYKIWSKTHFYVESSNIIAAWFMSGLIILSLAYVTHTGEEFSRIWVGTLFALSLFTILSLRAVNRFVISKSSSAFNQKYITIIGAGSQADKICRTLASKPWSGIKVAGIFDDNSNITGMTLHDVPIVGGTKELLPFIENSRRNQKKPISQVWIALPPSEFEKIEAIQTDLKDTATGVYYVPDIFSLDIANYKASDVLELPLVSMSAPKTLGPSATLKRFMDIVVSLGLLAVLSPLFLVVSLLIKRESKGPVFFKQTRYGEGGKEFLVWKFRSMTVTENSSEKIVQATRNDSRVTKIGAFIRKTSIDELPQLINVLLGNMSLVGPRPHAAAHNELYRKQVSGYMMRHQVKPGITGWAQVNGSRGETKELKDMELRVKYDLEYIKNWSLFLDLKILLRTFKIVANTENTY